MNYYMVYDATTQGFDQWGILALSVAIALVGVGIGRFRLPVSEPERTKRIGFGILVFGCGVCFVTILLLATDQSRTRYRLALRSGS